MDNQTEEIKSVSSTLMDAMRVKNLSVEKVANATGVSENFISAILDENSKKLPPAPYVHGYLLKIAEALGLDGEKLWQSYLKSNDGIRRSGERDHLPSNRFAANPVKRSLVIAVLVIVLVLGYVGIKVFSYLSTPNLTLAQISDNMVVTDPQFTIHGTTDPSNKLTVNGDAVYPDKNGNFEASVDLQPGFNTITFKIKKLLGRDYTITKQIFYQTPQTVPGAQQNNPLEPNATH
jgi:transcriptional regulator with XRE-family HTH domain